MTGCSPAPTAWPGARSPSSRGGTSGWTWRGAEAASLIGSARSATSASSLGRALRQARGGGGVCCGAGVPPAGWVGGERPAAWLCQQSERSEVCCEVLAACSPGERQGRRCPAHPPPGRRDACPTTDLAAARLVAGLNPSMPRRAGARPASRLWVGRFFTNASSFGEAPRPAGWEGGLPLAARRPPQTTAAGLPGGAGVPPASRPSRDPARHPRRRPSGVTSAFSSTLVSARQSRPRADAGTREVLDAGGTPAPPFTLQRLGW